MSRILLTLSVSMIVVMLVGADMRRNSSGPIMKPLHNRPCYGYTIIEFGKGIDCNGDTVKLMKVRGGQQRDVEDQEYRNVMEIANAW